MSEKQTGIQLIEGERQRQIEKEQWSADHDDDHDMWQLSRAAEAYLWELRARRGDPRNDAPIKSPPPVWPWEDEDWKPTEDKVRQLVKAGALIAAEIDRLQRITP